MKRLVFCFGFIVLCTCFIALAIQKVKREEYCDISSVGVSKLNLGEHYPENESITLPIPLKNTTESVAAIKVNSMSCGCMAAPQEEFTIQPGCTYLLPIKINTRSRNGENTISLNLNVNGDFLKPILICYTIMRHIIIDGNDLIDRFPINTVHTAERSVLVHREKHQSQTLQCQAITPSVKILNCQLIGQAGSYLRFKLKFQYDDHPAEGSYTTRTGFITC